MDDLGSACLVVGVGSLIGGLIWMEATERRSDHVSGLVIMLIGVVMLAVGLLRTGGIPGSSHG
jgi:hypothetical protein